MAGNGEQSAVVPAGRRIPWRLWRHILGEFLGPLALCLIGFSVLFIFLDVTDDLADFANSGIPVQLLVRYFLAKLPPNMIRVIPISVLLATSCMTIVLGKNNELTAMRASGLSLAVCAVPVWICAGIMCLFSFGIAEWLAPGCREYHLAIRSAWKDGLKAKAVSAEPLVYACPATGRDWFFQNLSRQGHGERVVVRQYGEDGRTAWVLEAAQSSWKNGEWRFQDCLVRSYAYVVGSAKPEVQESSLPERLETWPERPQEIFSASQSSGEQNLQSILHALKIQNAEKSRNTNYLKVMVWNRLTFPLASLVAACFGFALSIATGRSGLAKGFASSVGAIILFFLLGEFLVVLGKNGTLGAFLGGGASNLAFLAWGAWLVRKRR